MMAGCHCIVGTTRCVNGESQTCRDYGGKLGPIKYGGGCPEGQHCNRAHPNRCVPKKTNKANEQAHVLDTGRNRLGQHERHKNLSLTPLDKNADDTP
jgi:hypothetical protein